MKTPRILFMLRLDKLNKRGEAPIYCRITVDHKAVKFSIGRCILPKRWDATDKLQKARKPEDRELIHYMDSIRNRIKEVERDLLDSKKPITAENIKNTFSGKIGQDKKSKSLIEVFELHNKRFQELVQSEQAAPGTLDRYQQTLKHIKAFLKSNYSKSDILLEELDYPFVTNFDHYLRTERKNEKGRIRKCANNSAVKYVVNFRKIIKWAVDEEWIKYDPFIKYKRKIFKVERQCLIPDEINIIKKKEITIPRLSIIRDIFIFAVYTGYCYSDVKKLTYANVQRHIDGELWVFANRQKTKVKENVMLLDPAMQLIEKYKSHPECIATGNLFPVPSNQKTNAYLKELADICGIKKTLTFHIARHSFATSIMLANGLSMETTRDVIGHLHIKETEIYGKMLNTKVSADMKKLNKKFKRKPDGDSNMSVVG